ncbi:probable glutathione S-transferase DHAR2, chloroplastic isoform X2 [Hordeum vulgare subsp. vulgare]|uniref:probable glutathione S-transferase DHAR2, chloroplastic isoform X2 n=1 Tax=Hordeum vulgare subsp. vulgare TaxID=112509 RepID=UPI001D1A44E6|nr:probable glutathione S-transferase DHAR2, chloroplastic isoform X2 [Hordeum vulgare subsp. vulgare]
MDPRRPNGLQMLHALHRKPATRSLWTRRRTGIRRKRTYHARRDKLPAASTFPPTARRRLTPETTLEDLLMAVLLRTTSCAAATTAGSSSTLLATTFRRDRRLLPSRASPARRAFTTRASAEPLEVCAKASITVPDRLGDCPFTQRVLLTIEEKNLPYELKLVDLANKPDWLFTINPEGKVPIVKLEDKWVADSDVITQVLEEKYPQPSLATPPEKASMHLGWCNASTKPTGSPIGSWPLRLGSRLAPHTNTFLRALSSFVRTRDQLPGRAPILKLLQAEHA